MVFFFFFSIQLNWTISVTAINIINAVNGNVLSVWCKQMETKKFTTLANWVMSFHTGNATSAQTIVWYSQLSIWVIFVANTVTITKKKIECVSQKCTQNSIALHSMGISRPILEHRYVQPFSCACKFLRKLLCQCSQKYFNIERLIWESQLTIL